MTFRRLAVVVSTVAVAALTVGACSGSPGSSSAPLASAAAATAAPANGAEVDAAGFAAALKRPGTVVLDVRTPAEFAAGHLAGAVNVDVNAADFRTIVGGLAKDVPYAVYCRSGNRSATALAIMKGLGFTNTFHLGGGIQAWTAAGGAVTQ
ncbi:MAG: rhodanese-like domain-containing protein [Actinomycetales bacterium]|jgi:phage shock protein E|uniref:Rhodanese-like domain-containing protein n=1 Tax=Candidatus Phosphoribacter hodrii TaxID=2953743 RepID=A0A935IPI9_9MICO|nr:rhodanese-like domain-containing protein [Candidatus Phosphoribacter hodrii]